MKAVVLDRKLHFDPAYPDPAPGAGECVVRVSLAGICATDLHIVDGYMDFRGVLGHEMVGTVVQGSPQWLGKRVVAEINCVCGRCDMCAGGLGKHCRSRTVMGIAGRDGCFAEMVAVPEVNLHAVPDSISDEEAVFIEPLAAAYQVLAQCRLDSRSSVAVVGTGRLGLLIVQVLAQTGCRLTAIGRNRMKLDLCEKKGVQAVHVDHVTPKNDRDVVVECTGSPAGMQLALRLVRPRGTIILKSTYAGDRGPNHLLVRESFLAPGQPSDVIAGQPMNMSATKAGARTSAEAINLSSAVVDEVTIVGSRCGPFREAVQALEREAVDVRSLISRTFPLDQALAAFTAARDPAHVKILLRTTRRET